MDYSKAIGYLRSAEQELRSQISVDTNGSDYEVLYDCLKYAQQVSELIKVLEGMGKPVTVETNVPQQKAYATSKKPKKSQEILPEGKLPAYFIYQDKLWKIAKSTKDTESLYHKSVATSDVEIVLDAVSKALKAQRVVTIADIENSFNVKPPSYKTQITTMALLATGILKTVGRGKYSLAGNSSVTRRGFMNALERLKPRTDLLEKAGVVL